MKIIDVFNGDADGVCSLVQLRRAYPQQSECVTGIKRNINLLKQVEADAETRITVLDISFEKNAEDVKRLLAQGAQITYIDHHKTGKLIRHPNLTTDIDLDANICTALIVDKQLQGRYRAWAITAAFGDNLTARATELAQESGFTPFEIDAMQQLGILLNYNGYGGSLDDLFFHPAELYAKCVPFDTPFEFLQQDAETYHILQEGYQQDMAKAAAAPVIFHTESVTVMALPDAVWARRVSGVWSNALANQHPDKAHAVLTHQPDGHYLVSVRAPLNRKWGADEVVSQFETGGGRKAAAGINRLPESELDRFFQVMEHQFSSQ